MTENGIIGTVIDVQSDGKHTLMTIVTGSNGDRREEAVFLPVREVPFETGMAVRLTNFKRGANGVLTPDQEGEITSDSIEEFIKVEKSKSARRARPSMLTPAAKSAGKLMVFNDREERQSMFNRAVEVAKEFAEHIKRSGQLLQIQGRPFVTVAGWSLLPAFEGANVLIASHEIRPDGTIIAEAGLSKDGVLVSRGFGACTEKERPSLHNRLAMAQTRARGNCLKSRYSVLVTLAGYEASLADEVADAAPACGNGACKCVKAPPTRAEQPLPSQRQIDYATKIFDGDAKAILTEAANLGFLTFEVKDIPTPILKRIVERRLAERTKERTAAATKAA